MGTKKIDNFFGNENQDLRIKVNIGIEHSKRSDIINFLSTLLASTFILSLETFSCHWNVRDKDFVYLQNVTKEQYDDLLDGVNNIAERIRILGWNIPDTYTQVKRMSEINDENFDATTVIARLIKSNEDIILLIRNKLQNVIEAKDEASLDMLKERLKNHEKNTWVFRSILER